jgi:endoglucanase
MRIHIAKALRLLWLALALVALPLTVRAEVPPARLQTLSRGINLTNWFRFPAREDDTYLRNYISDRVLAQLKAAGFTFVRLPVQPELMLTRQGLPD